MKRFLLTMAVLTVLVSGALGSVPHTQAAGTINYTLPITSALSNPCVPENVQFSGTFHYMVSTTFDRSGSLHLGVHVNGQDVSGVGQTTGAQYRIPVAEEEQEILQQEGTLIERVKAVSQGSAPNFVVILTEHATVDANGNITSFHVDFDTACHG
jgi:hypothetical protein